MRILFCSLNFSPELTATGKYTGEMAEWLAKKGHDVTVIAAPPHYPKWEVPDEYKGRKFFSQMESGVMVMRVPCYIPKAARLNARTRILMESTFSLLSLFWWIPILFRRSKYDIAIAVCPPMQTALLPWLYKLIRKVPYVFHVQDFQVDMAMELGMIKKNLFTKSLYKIERLLLFNATRVTTITEAMLNRARLKGIPSKNLELCPNWSNVNIIKPSSHKNSFRDEHKYSYDDFLVLYSGAMGQKQGLEIILEAAKNMKEEKHIKFLIVGNGAARDALESAVKSDQLQNVKFLDIQPFERLPTMLSAANIHLVVQKSKATDLVMPSKLTNILASGRPAIATAYPESALGIIIEKYDTGLLIEPENSSQLTDAILKLSKSPSDMMRKGANARRYAEQYLDINKIMEEFSEMLEKVVANN